MNIVLLHNADHALLEDDPGREARQDVLNVAFALREALQAASHHAELLPIEPHDFSFVQRLATRKPDVVINLCESLAGDSQGEMAVPCLLDTLNLPYSGSSALALGLALHKDKAKQMLRAHGVLTPLFFSVESDDELSRVDAPYPLIVKPLKEDASVGIDFDSVVHNSYELKEAVYAVWETFRQPALVEGYVAGREIYVSLIGNSPRNALPLTEIRFGKAFEGKPNIVSYQAKWALDSDEYRDSPSVPCIVEASMERELIEVALSAFEALGCRDYGRVDLRLALDGTPYVIDINPNCDLHPTAGFAKAAAMSGLSYSDLAQQLVAITLERYHGNTSSQSGRPRISRNASLAHRDLLASRG